MMYPLKREWWYCTMYGSEDTSDSLKSTRAYYKESLRKADERNKLLHPGFDAFKSFSSGSSLQITYLSKSNTKRYYFASEGANFKEVSKRPINIYVLIKRAQYINTPDNNNNNRRITTKTTRKTIRNYENKSSE